MTTDIYVMSIFMSAPINMKILKIKHSAHAQEAVGFHLKISSPRNHKVHVRQSCHSLADLPQFDTYCSVNVPLCFE